MLKTRKSEKVIIPASREPGKALRAHRNSQTNWRGWVIALAVALGVLVGALAAGRLKVTIHR